MSVNMLNDQMLRALRIIQVANDSGYYPLSDEVNSLVGEREPKAAHTETRTYNVFEGMSIVASGKRTQVVNVRGSREGCRYLNDVGWIQRTKKNEEDDEQHHEPRWEITRFGKIILTSETNSREGESDDAYCVTFDSEDPLVYSKLLQTLSAETRDLLVDPYFKAEYMDYISKTKISRILMMKDSGRDNSRNIDDVALALGELKRHNYPFPEIRTVSKKKLHDRFLMDQDGTVYMLGTSINSLDQHTSSLLKYPYIDGARPKALLDGLWESGETITPTPAVTETQSNNEERQDS